MLAPVDGTISFAGSLPSSGKSVTIQTPDGLSVTLTHLGTIGIGSAKLSERPFCRSSDAATSARSIWVTGSGGNSVPAWRGGRVGAWTTAGAWPPPASLVAGRSCPHNRADSTIAAAKKCRSISSCAPVA